MRIRFSKSRRRAVELVGVGRLQRELVDGCGSCMPPMRIRGGFCRYVRMPGMAFSLGRSRSMICSGVGLCARRAASGG